MSREAMKQALEALELYQSKSSVQMFDDAVKALRQALETEQEPVAWISEGGDVSRSKRYMDEMGFKCNPLYTAPPKREWVGLTDEEKSDLWCESTGRDWVNEDTHVFADAIEAKLKERNT